MDLMVLAMARKYMDKKVAELVSAGWTKEIVKELPTIGNDKTIYMIEQVDDSGNTYYDEYMYTNGKFDGIGTTRVDLSNYAKLDMFNPYHFNITKDYIDVKTYDPDDYNTNSSFVQGYLFDELKGQVTGHSTRIDNNEFKISNIEEDMERLSSAYIYKGSVGTYSGLPCGDKVLKAYFSYSHYIELSFPDNAIPKDATKIRIEAKSSAGANYNFILMGTSNKSYNFYIQKDRYTAETIDINDFDYSKSNGKFRISFTGNVYNALEIDKIYFLNSVGSTVKVIFNADIYTINSKGPVVDSTVTSVKIAYKDPDLAAEQKSTLQIGDVYNVSDSDKNYAWNGTDWDSLGGTFSLTNYQPREDTRLKTTSKDVVGAINEIKININDKADKTYVNSELDKKANLECVDSKAEQSQVNNIAEELGNVQTELTNTKNRLSDIEHGKVNVIMFTDTLDSRIYEFKNISSKADVFLINSEKMVEESTLVVYYTDETQEVFMYNGGENLIHFDKSKGISFIVVQNYESLGKVTIQYLVDTNDYVDEAIKSAIGNALEGEY